ncbi:MAG: tRNA (adenosine(37)-N6)-threonylcarbamoyltransferase complex dimerization subunit type 1 TsaB [Sporomusaceae bacterium]|nr:tRNA (adenosine(37)-N6)-threonylcarbamoyltransferase complex dimerization subunit type 1 TsaB [Sporomusaceae bacterium]
MLILALDTATLVSSVALDTEEKLLAEFTLQTTKTHSEKLLPTIDALCRFAAVEPEHIEAIAVSIGPGSFTGLRIGLATAKAMSYVRSLPLIGVPTLAGLAYNLAGSTQILAPVLDAQKGNVYMALYEFTADGIQERMPVTILKAEAAYEKLVSLARKVTLLGESAQVVQAAGDNNPLITVAPPHLLMPRAASIAAAARQLYQQGKVFDAMTLEPIYIRRSEAEVLWEKRQQNQMPMLQTKEHHGQA